MLDFPNSGRYAIRIRHNNLVYLISKDVENMTTLEKILEVKRQMEALKQSVVNKESEIVAVTLAKDIEIAVLKTQLAEAIAAAPADNAEQLAEAEAANLALEKIIAENQDNEASKDQRLLEAELDGIIMIAPASEPPLALESIV
jgi:hypothetical protein